HYCHTMERSIRLIPWEKLMTLEEAVLQKLAEWRPVGSERQTVTVSHDPKQCSISFSIERNDDLSCSLWEMSERLQRSLAEAGVDLKTWAERVASQVRGLLEPLCVVEIDDRRNEALLRSQEPTVRKNERYYYEVLLRATGQADVRRYRG